MSITNDRHLGRKKDFNIAVYKDVDEVSSALSFFVESDNQTSTRRLDRLNVDRITEIADHY